MPSAQNETTKARSKVYYDARNILIERHQDEYRQILQELADKAGVTLTLRLSPEEKAEQQLRELLAANPQLAEKYRPVEETETEEDPALPEPTSIKGKSA